MELKKNERTNGYTAELEIAVGREEFEKAIERAYQQNRGKISVPGFRKGKAPRKMIEKMYGEGIFYEDAVNLAFPDAYQAAVEEAGITPVDQANVELIDLSREGFSFKATVTIRPSIDAGDYQSIRVEKTKDEVTDESVDAEIRRMAERNARIETVEREAQDGDTANIDFEGFVNDVAFEGGKGEQYDLRLGSGTFIPGFEEQIIGHKAGDEFDVNVKFPEDYNPDLAGKDAVFKVVLHEVKETILPELDDEFAKDVSEFDTLEELKKDTRENLEKSADARSEERFEAELMEKLAALVTDEIPEIMYENAIDSIVQDFSYRMSMQGINIDQYLQMTGSTMEQFRAGFRDRAEQQVKVGLELEAVAKAEGFEVTDEEIEAEYQKLATEQMSVEQVKTYLSADAVRSDVLTDKTINRLKEIAAQSAE